MVVVLFNAGDQVPVMPLFEIVGNALNVLPEQIAVTGVNNGTTGVFTVIVIVVLPAHCPTPGVKVYVVVVVLFIAGDQVPLMPFVDVAGNGLSVPPEQIGETGLKVGVIAKVTNTLIVVSIAH